MEKINIVAGMFTAFNFETLTVSNSATPFTASAIVDSENQYAKKATLSVEGASFRYRYDGGNPTSAVGHFADEGDFIIIIGSTNIRNFKAIRTGSTNATIRCTYER